MIHIRNNVFETNSSSTHSLTIAPKSQYEAWLIGDGILYDGDCRRFIAKEEAIEKVRLYEYESGASDKSWYNPLKDYYYRNDIEQEKVYKNIDDVPEELIIPYLAYHEYYTSDEFDNGVCEYYEQFEQHYTTEHGDEVVAFGYYGENY